jgi:hypothetical protein
MEREKGVVRAKKKRLIAVNISANRPYFGIDWPEVRFEIMSLSTAEVFSKCPLGGIIRPSY